MRILFLDLDTLRPDHLGCYGYLRNTSPNIDRVAADGVRFDQYYCSDAPCLPSRSALMSGRFGIHTGVVGHGGTAADPRLEGAERRFRSAFDRTCLPAIFRRAGMRTVTVSPFAERHSAWWFYAGFTEAYNTGMCGMESAEQVTPVALDWIARHGSEDNWFLHVNYWDAHTPYRAPSAFGDPFAAAPLPAWLTAEALERHRRYACPHGPHEISMYDNRMHPAYPRHPGELRDLSDVRRMIDGYDTGIRYMDEHLGRLFEALAKAGVFEDLTIVITADHGENQGELGIYGEHATADAATCRIPMIVRGPGVRRGYVDRGLRYNLDLAPTLAEILKQERQPGWDGRSFAAALSGEDDPGWGELILSQCAHVCQRSVRFDRWLFTRTYHDGYHLFPDEMLFDLEADPHEEHDVAAQLPEVCGEAMRRLERWHATMRRGALQAEDPLWTVMREGGPLHARGHLAQYCERLQSTGRAWAVPELRRRHPEEFKS